MTSALRMHWGPLGCYAGIPDLRKARHTMKPLHLKLARGAAFSNYESFVSKIRWLGNACPSGSRTLLLLSTYRAEGAPAVVGLYRTSLAIDVTFHALLIRKASNIPPIAVVRISRTSPVCVVTPCVDMRRHTICLRGNSGVDVVHDEMKVRTRRLVGTDYLQPQKSTIR